MHEKTYITAALTPDFSTPVTTLMHHDMKWRDGTRCFAILKTRLDREGTGN